MFVFYKALFAVLGIAAVVFIVGRPLFLRFMSLNDFTLRRNLWLTLTLAAFVIPNFWVFLVISAVLIVYTATRDSNPVALYMMLLLTLPPVGKELPTFGMVNQLLLLDNLRFLSLVLLLPMALGYFRREPAAIDVTPNQGSKSGWLPTDVLIVLFVVLQIVLVMPSISITATSKRMILIATDILLPYYVLSRACHTRESFQDMLAAFFMAAVVLVPLAVFETSKGWLLYFGFADHWDTASYMNYLSRGSNLRAQVNAGHSIVLGFTFAIAVGFWIALQTRVTSVIWRWGAPLALLVGLLVTFARGPWLGTVAIWVIYLRLGPDAGQRTVKALGLLVIVGLALAVSPWSATVIDNVPFIGSVGNETVDYRQKLAQTSWMLVLQNPIFGSLNFLSYMEDLRQGEGIIDLVNTYATIALGYGLVGLGLYLTFFSLIVIQCLKSMRRVSTSDADFALTGSALIATLIGALAMLTTVAMYMSIGSVTWALAGMGVSYVRLARGDLAVKSRLHVDPFDE